MICLGEGTANGGGNVHINTCANTGSLPSAMVMLVLCDDVICGEELTYENPESYLFGNSRITFDDTTDPGDPV